MSRRQRPGRLAGLAGVACGGLLTIGLPFARAAAPPTPQARQEVAFRQVCGKCHTAEMVASTPKSFDAWQETVQAMIDHGAKGTDDQFNDVLAYLYANLTTIDVNAAPADDLKGVLGVPAPVAEAILARRAVRPFAGLDDLKSVAGVDPAALEAKAKLIFF